VFVDNVYLNGSSSIFKMFNKPQLKEFTTFYLVKFLMGFLIVKNKNIIEDCFVCPY
jgi:preprotein translocase subunit Sss1